jgi:hypothetical protein
MIGLYVVRGAEFCYLPVAGFKCFKKIKQKYQPVFKIGDWGCAYFFTLTTMSKNVFPVTDH